MNSHVLRSHKSCYPLALAAGMSLLSTQSFALSCSAGADGGAGGGVGYICSGSDYIASVELNQSAATYDRFGSAYVNASTGSMGGHITIADNALPGGPGLGSGRFFSNFAETVRINGPASSTPVIAAFMFGTEGTIAGIGTGEITYSFALDGIDFSGFQVRVGGARSHVQDWTVNSTAFGLGSSINWAPATPDVTAGMVYFDVRSVLGFRFAVKGSLGGSVSFGGVGGIEGAAITADASHTSLFNFVLPDGYSLSALNTNFLSNPQLQTVPVPAAVWLFVSGLLGLISMARRKNI